MSEEQQATTDVASPQLDKDGSVKRLTIPTPPPLPPNARPLIRRMHASIVGYVEEARSFADTIYRYTVGKAHETEALKSSDAAEAIAWRKRVATRNERVDAFNATFKEQIRQFEIERDEAIAVEDQAVAEAEALARKANNLAVGVTAEDYSQALEEYRAVGTMVKDTVNRMVKQGASYVYALPSQRNAGRASGEKKFTPRFSSITVNDEPLVDKDGEALTKMGDLAEFLGEQTGRNVKRDDVHNLLMAQALNNDRAVWDALESESPVSFTYTVTNVDTGESQGFAITVTKAPPPERKDSKSTDEAPDDDESDDEE